MARAEITWRSCIFGESAGYMGKPDVSQTSCRRHDDTRRSRPFAMCVKQKHRLTRSPGPGGRRSPARGAWPGCRWPAAGGGCVYLGGLRAVARLWCLEPWLSSCRAFEAPSRRCRGAVEALPVEPVPCRVPDRVPVEVLLSLSRLRSVEVCRGLSSCRAVEPYFAYSFAHSFTIQLCMKHSDSHSSRPRGPTHKPPTKLGQRIKVKALGDQDVTP